MNTAESVCIQTSFPSNQHPPLRDNGSGQHPLHVPEEQMAFAWIRKVQNSSWLLEYAKYFSGSMENSGMAVIGRRFKLESSS